MRQQITIHVGQAANQLLPPLWQQLSHNQRSFRTAASGRLVPRCLLVDLEPGVLNWVRGGQLGKTFSPDSYFNLNNGAGNNWAKGHYSQGSELINQILQGIQRETQYCDSLESFELLHSLGGGTGSGLGTLIVEKLSQNYSDKLIQTVSIYPHQSHSDTVLENYNTILATNSLIQNADSVLTVSNAALLSRCKNNLALAKFGFQQMNQLVATTLSCLNQSFSCPGNLNTSSLKLSLNLIPFPRLKFLSAGVSPLSSIKSKAYGIYSQKTLVRQAIDIKNQISCLENGHEKVLTGSFICKGNLSVTSLLNEIKHVKTLLQAASFIPDSFSASLAALQATPQLVFLSNSCGFQNRLSQINRQFESMFRRKAFVHHFLMQGMVQQQFMQAGNNVDDLCRQYQQYSQPGQEKDEVETTC